LCEAFLYALSPESVESEWCQWEFDQAVRMGKAIIPVLLQGKTKLPEVLARYQYADFSEGATPQGVARLMGGLSGVTVKIAPQELATVPENPKGVPAQALTSQTMPSDAPSISVDEAASALEANDFERAAYLLKAIKAEGRLKRIVTTMLYEAEKGLEQQRLARRAEAEYRPIAELVKRERTRKMGCAEFEDFQREFPDYDPENLAQVCGESAVSKPRASKVGSILPAPFEWIEVPAGKVTLIENYNETSYFGQKGEKKMFEVPAFAIAKYPVTNAQFAQFIEVKGYEQKKWWTEDGWQLREKKKWTQPRYWGDKKWNEVDCPVVGVSWYEALAFCHWLSEAAGEAILLPTEQQW
jgi:sulfatase-modifying factor enzyme 1/TIR domain-containing protein